LAIQIHQSLLTYGSHLKLKHAVVYGGVGQGNQARDLSNGVDVLVATPGRLMDLHSQQLLSLHKVETFVLDEADRMLDMGFIQDIQRILPLLPKKRHNLFFSATMAHDVQKLASGILENPKKVEVTPQATTAEKINQSVMFVEKSKKLELLVHLLQDPTFTRVLVFMSMKHGANRVVDKLVKHGISAAGIHGDKSQGARQRALEEFREGKVRVLVATDIAARGLDIDGISHVINYELPHVAETYVHRIGRTARAGAEGKSIAFCTAEEKSYLFAIEKTTRQQITVVTDQPYHSAESQSAPVMSVGQAKAAIEKRIHAAQASGRATAAAAGTGQAARSGAGRAPRTEAESADASGPRSDTRGGPRRHRSTDAEPQKRTSFFNKKKFGFKNKP
ncbi:MAG: DEAD/DEAH box helicase, partial [Bdellovibrionaceae bacterium]|nr:DEAD/DEAH box helicase [Pseudobdellovibrionaceae bacterium]